MSKKTAFIEWVEQLISGSEEPIEPSEAALAYWEAFKSKELPKHHSNLTECHTIAEAFDRLGYNVDCASRGKTGIDYSCYDVVMGINCSA